MDYINNSYEELIKERNKLETEYNALSDDCAKKGVSYMDFKEQATPIRQKLYFIEKYIRLKQSPTIDYGKEWNGDIIPIEKFIELSENGSFMDYDGIGYYSVDNAKSDITACPSDFIENIYRKDFTHIIWFNK